MINPQITISELSDTDFGSYVEYCSILKQLTSINIENITMQSFSHRIQMIRSNPFHQIFIAKFEGKIIGTTTVLIEPKIIHDLSFVAHIEDVVVDSESRTKGIGTSLMLHAIAYAKDHCCYKIILDCSDKNVSFYEKLGFDVKEKHMAMYI